jgi:CMP-N-acetylneuraminic acid synthetase
LSRNPLYICRSPSSGRHVAALILARGGSKSIPLKNLALVGGRSLLTSSLSVVQRVDFSSVWVSTDHERILEEAGPVNVHWRSTESATDDASSVLGILDFVESHPEVDVIALVQCTSPFVRSRYLEQALEWVKRGRECVFSASRQNIRLCFNDIHSCVLYRSHSLRWFQEADGRVRPINFDIKKRPRRQDWSGEFVENGMFYFVERKLVKRGFLQSARYSVPSVSN